jgi:acetolactate synthase regulatory subunit
MNVGGIFFDLLRRKPLQIKEKGKSEDLLRSYRTIRRQKFEVKSYNLTQSFSSDLGTLKHKSSPMDQF